MQKYQKYSDRLISNDESLLEEYDDINKLFDLTVILEEYEKQSNYFGMLQSMNDTYAELEQWDSVLDSFYKSDIYDSMKFYVKDKSIVSEKEIKKIIQSQYYNIDNNNSENEILVNQLHLANRLSKLPESYKDRIEGKEGRMRRDLNNFYSELLLADKDTTYNFLKQYKISKGESGKLEINRKDCKCYSEFMKIYDKLNKKYQPKIEFYDFYRYAKMQYCESFFYKLKDQRFLDVCNKAREENEKENQVKKIEVMNDSFHDTKDDLNLALIRINLPGYICPFMLHMKKDEIENITGEEFYNLKIKSTNNLYPGRPIITFKMNSELLEAFSYMPYDSDKRINYMIDSARNYIQLEKEQAKEQANVEVKEETKEETKEEKDIDVNKKEDSDIQNKDIAKLNNEQITNTMIDYFKQITGGEEVDEKYKEALGSIGKTIATPFRTVYKKVEDYLREKFASEGKNLTEEELQTKSKDMYVYMKIAKKGFWSCIQTDGDQVLENTYSKYKKNRDVFVEALNKGVDVDQINTYIRMNKSHMDPDKPKRKYVRKNKTLEEKEEQQISTMPENVVEQPKFNEDIPEQEVNQNEKLKKVIKAQEEYLHSNEKLLEAKKQRAELNAKYIELANKTKEVLSNIGDVNNLIEEQEKQIKEVMEMLKGFGLDSNSKEGKADE